jgi:pimeloyl-ACP methyl ester carboxylesterase
LISNPYMLRIQDVDLELFDRGSGPPLLYLHDENGWGGSAEILDRLSERFRVLAPSHPGFGRSSLPDWYDSVDDLAYFYLDLLEHLDLQDVRLVGASFGGWIAAEVAVRCSQRLSRLVLVDPLGIKPGDRETADIADVFALPPGEVLRRTWHIPPDAPDMSSTSDDDLAVIARNREALALFTWEPYAHNPKLLRRLHRIRIPTLLIWGASDRIVELGYARAYQTAIPGSKLEIIAEAGHLPLVEQPEQFIARLLPFLLQAEGYEGQGA